jgi:hypothetical protein
MRNICLFAISSAFISIVSSAIFCASSTSPTSDDTVKSPDAQSADHFGKAYHPVSVETVGL